MLNVRFILNFSMKIGKWREKEWEVGNTQPPQCFIPDIISGLYFILVKQKAQPLHLVL